MSSDPRKTTEIEPTAGACHGNVGEAGVRFTHGFRDRATTVVVLVAVRRQREVIGDLYRGPFPAFGLVGRGDHDVGLVLVGQCRGPR